MKKCVKFKKEVIIKEEYLGRLKKGALPGNRWLPGEGGGFLKERGLRPQSLSPPPPK